MDTGATGGGQRLPETTTDLVLKLPAPPQHPIASSPVLITEEQNIFARCEVAVENLKVAFWAAGKALQIIRDGRLYRVGYTSFDEYLDQRWDMSRGNADKLIRMWPIAQALFDSADHDSNDPTRIRVRKLHQSTVWELVPVAEGHDVQTATAVYRTTHQLEEGTVTAGVVRAVVKAVMSAIPKGKDVEEATLSDTILNALTRPADKPKPRKQKTAPAPAAELPWASPDRLNALLRRHMTVEDRKTLGKMLLAES
ncbi:hypothetical protein [Streptomyces sp. NPDC054952]